MWLKKCLLGAASWRMTSQVVWVAADQPRLRCSTVSLLLIGKGRIYLCDMNVSQPSFGVIPTQSINERTRQLIVLVSTGVRAMAKLAHRFL
jgi:hypothetical protein